MLADFASPCHARHFHYEEHLQRMKRRSSASVSDSSGFSDSESECALRAGARRPEAPAPFAGLQSEPWAPAVSGDKGAPGSR